MALKIAKYIIHYCKLNKKPINARRLQQYLYLIQIFGNFLFDDDFEAWKWGPVIPDVYYKYNFKVFRNPMLDTSLIHELNDLTESTIDVILSKIDTLSDEELIKLTCGPNSPWRRLYNNAEYHNCVIPKLEIAKHAIELKNLRKEYDKRNAEQNETDKTVKTNETETVHQTVSEKTTVSYGSQSIHKHVTVELDVDVKLEKNDIFNWLNACNDTETLRYLGKFALKRAKNIENPDNDDFRSII